MHTAIRADYIAHFAHLQTERRLFKRLLHLPGPKPSQITAFLVGGAIGMKLGKFGEFLFRSGDLSLVAFENSDSLVFGARYVRLYMVRAI